MAGLKPFEVIMKINFAGSNGLEIVAHAEKVAELVRCGDCKHYLNSNEKCELIDTRLHFYETDKVWASDCFCAWAERRTK